MRCDTLLLKSVLFFGSSLLDYAEGVMRVDLFKQYKGKQLPTVFETYQGLSQIQCARRIKSHACSGANYDKQTGDCGLSTSKTVSRTEMDVGRFEIIMLQSDDCTDYLISGPDGVPDESITASSSYSLTTHLPKWGRLIYKEINAYGEGSWSSKIDDQFPWIQARFNTQKNATGLAIQGRQDFRNQYVKEFRVSYSLDCTAFQDVYNFNDTVMKFTANSDPTTIVTQMFPTPILAVCVRLHPTDWEDHISLRWDIIGC